MDRVDVKRLTAEDVLREGSPWRDCELWDGLPMVREPSGGWSEAVGARVVGPLEVHVRAGDLGWVFMSSQGFLIARDPDRLLAADGAYVSRARLPRIPEREFIPLAPDFVLEVKSPDDTWEATVEKCGIWIAHGSRVAWAVDPLARSVATFRSPAESRVLVAMGEIDGAPALPDFRMTVESLFAGL